MIKIRMKQQGKAIVRFKNEAEEQWFYTQMIQLRDMKISHPEMSVKNIRGIEAPKLPERMPPAVITKPTALPVQGVPPVGPP